MKDILTIFQKSFLKVVYSCFYYIFYYTCSYYKDNDYYFLLSLFFSPFLFNLCLIFILTKIVRVLNTFRDLRVHRFGDDWDFRVQALHGVPNGVQNSVRAVGKS